jgi:uncharacterized membrane protein (UPF0127 family)
MTRRFDLLTARLTLPLILVLLASCAPDTDSADRQPAAAPADTPAARSVLPMPEATLTDGTVLTLELALTNEEIGQGLMFRPSLPADRGMLFVFQVERVPSFWMKDTMIPLDLVFLDRRGVIVEIIANAQPCAVEPCPQYIPSQAAMAVLEINGGVAERHGLAAGDQISFERVEGYPTAD